MCGIFSYLGNQYSNEELNKFSNKIQHRGPDSTINKRINNNLFFGFHRLAINGLNSISNQPFEINNIHLICNGEIFNFKNLIDKYNLKDKYISDSDCEIIIHLYLLLGIEKTCQELDGEFSFILYDANNDDLLVARDQLGIRSLYWSKDNNNNLSICSELKGLVNKNNVEQFPVSSYWSSKTNEIKSFFNFTSDEFTNDTEDTIINNFKILFTNAVKKRLMSDRGIACLLSGGLDSTTVTGIVAKYYPPFTINTYSIGLKGSVDLYYAKMAADYFKTNHTSIELTNEDFLDAIEKTIIQIESYDTTSIRASVGNYLISLYIRDHSDDKVIFCGDVSDEIFASYRGFYYADNNENFYEENVKMLRNIQYFDVLRSDKSISGAGLEARVPFSDKDFIKYVMSIKPEYKSFTKTKMEKYLFRKAFEDILPHELAWRVKTAFSDGVSSSEKPWYEIIKEYMDNKYSDSDFMELSNKYTYNKPYDKESLYYREIFEKYYPNCETTIPFFWKQPFMKDSDPSAWLAEKNQTI